MGMYDDYYCFINIYQYIRWQIPLEYIKFSFTFLFCSLLSESWNFRASYIQRIRGIHYTLWPFQYSINALLKILLIFLVYCSSLSLIVNCVGKSWNGWPFQGFVFPLAKRYIKLAQHSALNNTAFSFPKTRSTEHFCSSVRMKGMHRTAFCFKNIPIDDKKKTICNTPFSEGPTSWTIGIYRHAWHLSWEIFVSNPLLNSCAFCCLDNTFI